MAGDEKVDAALFFRVVYPAAGVDEAGIAGIGASYDRDAIFYCPEHRACSVLVRRAASAIPRVVGDDDEKLCAILDKSLSKSRKDIFEADKGCKIILVAKYFEFLPCCKFSKFAEHQIA